MSRPSSRSIARQKRTKAANSLARRTEERLALDLWRRAKSQITDQEIVEALEGADDPRFQQLLGILAIPQALYGGKRTYSLPSLLKRCGITYTEWIWFLAQRHFDEALLAVAPKSKAVLSDIADDARSTTSACWKCDGGGKVAGEGDGPPVACKECGGKGTIRKVGDADARWMFLKFTGFIKGGGGIQLQQNFVNWKGEADESFDALMRETDKIINVEVVQPAEESKGSVPSANGEVGHGA